MEPESISLPTASSETTTSEVHAERRKNTRDAACQTDGPFLGPQEPGPSATKRKNYESGEQAATGPDEPFQKKANISGWLRPAGMPPSDPEIKALAAKLLDRTRMKEVEIQQLEKAESSAGGECSARKRGTRIQKRIQACSGDSPAAAAAARPLPPRWPQYPKKAKRKQLQQYDQECRRISKLVAEDPLTKLIEDLPTLRKPSDPGTVDAVASSRDKEMVLRVARSIVGVSSTSHEGKVIWQCTGIVVSWDEAKKCARILTSNHIARDTGTSLDPKIYVHLPNKSVSDGQLLFSNKHYNIALLEITTDFPLQLPSFGSSPNYGQEIFVLARDKETFLLARHGTIEWRDEPDLLSRSYHMFLSCQLPGCGNGGPVIDHHGNVIGIAFGCMSQHGDMLASISTMLTCVEMWMKFSRIVRPIMDDLCLRSVELSDVGLLEKISYSYNIKSGYIVEKARFDSTAEKLGIRRGDVIVSFDELGVHPLPKLEDLLLSVGWEFLERGCDASTTVDFKLEVYDPIGNCTRNIVLPVGFCDAQDDECE